MIVVMTDATPLSDTARKASRDSLFLKATLRIDTQSDPVVVRVRNLSAGGMMVDGHVSLVAASVVSVELRGIGVVRGRVAWADAGRAGIAFDAQVDPRLTRTSAKKSVAPISASPMLADRRPGLRLRG